MALGILEPLGDLRVDRHLCRRGAGLLATGSGGPCSRASWLGVLVASGGDGHPYDDGLVFFRRLAEVENTKRYHQNHKKDEQPNPALFTRRRLGRHGLRRQDHRLLIRPWGRRIAVLRDRRLDPSQGPGHGDLLAFDLRVEEPFHELGKLLAAGAEIQMIDAVFQVGKHFAARIVTVVRMLRQSHVEHGHQTFGQIPHDPFGAGETRLAGLGKDVHGIAFVHVAAGHHLVYQNANGEDIRSMIDFKAVRLLRRHVGHFAFDHPGSGVGYAAGGFGDAEIDDLDLAVIGQKDILGAHITVNDVEQMPLQILHVMGIIQPRTDADRNMQRIFQAQGHASLFGNLEDRFEILAEKVFHGDEIALIQSPEIIYLNDVGMLQQRGQTRFIDEIADRLLFVREMRQNLFDGHRLFEPLFSGNLAAVEFGHTTHRNTIRQPVFSEF